VLPCVLAISRQSIGQHAQAKEAEAEKLRLSLRYLDRSSFQSFLSVFTQVLRKSGRKVTGKLAGSAILTLPANPVKADLPVLRDHRDAVEREIKSVKAQLEQIQKAQRRGPMESRDEV